MSVIGAVSMNFVDGERQDYIVPFRVNPNREIEVIDAVGRDVAVCETRALAAVFAEWLNEDDDVLRGNARRKANR